MSSYTLIIRSVPGLVINKIEKIKKKLKFNIDAINSYGSFVHELHLSELENKIEIINCFPNFDIVIIETNEEIYKLLKNFKSIVSIEPQRIFKTCESSTNKVETPIFRHKVFA